MIYLFCGYDRTRARAKATQVLAAFRKKNPTGAVFRFEAENFSQERFEELLAGAGGLFGEKRLIFCQELGENSAAADCLLEHLPTAAASAVVVLWLEPAADRALKERVKQAGGRVAEFIARPPTEFNLFSLTDAFGARDRARLWLEFQRSLAAGVPAEEVFWRLVWQLKTMRLAALVENPSTLKPYTAKKAKQFNQNFRSGELSQLAARLVRLWHETKREDGRDFPLELEHFLFNI